jgi:hypothetical protein
MKQATQQHGSAEEETYLLPVGERFGLLTVVGHPKNTRSEVKCLCDCGNTKITQECDLLKGRVKSCGCLKRTVFVEVGQKYGRLTLLTEPVPGNNKVDCVCDCGNKATVSVYNLVHGTTSSCGCMKSEMVAAKNWRHGASQRGKMRSEYRIWKGIMQRCSNPNNPQYKDYGGRGITMCQQWIDSFETFLNDVGPRPSLEYTLDRINNDLGYFPGNCHWATEVEQQRNQRGNRKITIDGETHYLTDWALLVGIKQGTISTRIHKLGWTEEEAIFTPVHKAKAETEGTSKTKTAEYQAWQNIKGRCLNPQDRSYQHYGGRGLTIYPEWISSFEAFKRDVGKRPSPAHSLDRIDNERGYYPDNVRWVTKAVQNRNTRRNHLITIGETTLCLNDWAEKVGIDVGTVRRRIVELGWSPEEALFTPSGKKRAGK